MLKGTGSGFVSFFKAPHVDYDSSSLMWKLKEPLPLFPLPYSPQPLATFPRWQMISPIPAVPFLKVLALVFLCSSLYL